MPDYTKFDYTIIYYGAKWYKGFFKNRFKKINKMLDLANDSLRINVLYVNIDLLDDNYPGSLLSEKYKFGLKIIPEKTKSCSNKCSTKQ